ncbi:Flagellar hook-associated protein FlgL [Marinobacterium lacunae]|uniref:Flagellar hook-associated protein FlgL n=1 Tax=Marinobacterium lacunae TaxID=1232683 RepID=A0A081G0L6_9GAMM|nr:flagellar hook-associated protein FlgL [Marinobacterium lacunae]KEA64321.1 Flagellar hook-associated protein FlgL [Marinobacterium lacunae]
MRVSTEQIYRSNIDQLNKLNTQIAKTQEQISSGERFSQPSEDPLASGQVLKLDKELARTEQYQNNIDTTERRLDLEETTLDALNNANIRLQEIATQAGNGTLSSDDIALLASEVKELVGEIEGLVNTRDTQGEYLFSGYQGLTRAYDYNETTGQYEFQGDGGQRYIQVGPDYQVASTDSALEIFEGAEGAFQPQMTDTTDSLNPVSIDSSFFTPYVDDYTEFEEFMADNSDFQVDLTAASVGVDAALTVSYTDADGVSQTFVYTLSEVDGAVTLTPDAAQSNADEAAALLNEDGTGVVIGGLELLMNDSALTDPDTSVSLSGAHDSDNILNYANDLYQAMKNADVDSYEGKLSLQQSLASALTAIESVQEQNISARASIGARINAIDDQRTVNDEYSLYTETARSNLIDTDLTEAASQLALQKTTLEASYSSFNIITGLSLFNYLS